LVASGYGPVWKDEELGGKVAKTLFEDDPDLNRWCTKRRMFIIAAIDLFVAFLTLILIMAILPGGGGGNPDDGSPIGGNDDPSSSSSSVPGIRPPDATEEGGGPVVSLHAEDDGGSQEITEIAARDGIQDLIADPDDENAGGSGDYEGSYDANIFEYAIESLTEVARSPGPV